MILVDTNILLDILTLDPQWAQRSGDRLEEALHEGIGINPIIYAEVAAGFTSQAKVEEALDFQDLRRLPLPYEAAFCAAQAFIKYRERGGQKKSPLPDFFIGAHAETAGFQLLTRDSARYQTYFPKVRLIHP